MTNFQHYIITVMIFACVKAKMLGVLFDRKLKNQAAGCSLPSLCKNTGSPAFPETLHCIRLCEVTGWLNYGSTLMFAENCTMLMIV